MPEAPTVSIIMPVYNCANYVGVAIESMLDQTLKDFEFIIINDGSTDSSLSIIQAYAEKDNRIKIIDRPNTGIVGALNDGLAQATGRFIARMDADDVSLPTRLKRQVDYLESDVDCVAVGAHVLFVDADGDPIWTYKTPTDHAAIESALSEGNGGALVHPSVMLRRGALLQIRGYDKTYQYVEDFDLYLRLLTLGKLHNLEETLLHYRQHPQSTNFTKHKQQRDLLQQRLTLFREERQLPAFTLEEEIYQQNPCEQHRQWSVWAMNENYVQSAWKHALKALKLKPSSLHSWRFIFYTFKQQLARKGESSQPH